MRNKISNENQDDVYERHNKYPSPFKENIKSDEHKHTQKQIIAQSCSVLVDFYILFGMFILFLFTLHITRHLQFGIITI